MENKREVIVKKIDKFAFNVKNLNIIIAVMLAVFLICFTVLYNKESARLDIENQRYQSMLEDLKKYQLSTIYSNVTPNGGYVDPSKVLDTPIFKDAKDAVSKAFEKYNNYTTHEVVTSGISNTEALGVNVEVKSSGLSVKYSDGMRLERSNRIETHTNFGQNGGEEAVYFNGQKYIRYGSNIRISGDEVVADYSGNFQSVNSELNNAPVFIVNESTIEFKRSFSFVRDNNNRIIYYKATVTLDPDLSTKDCKIAVKEQGGTSTPKFSKVELSCIIDSEGTLLSYTINHVMTCSKKVIIDVTATIETETKYTILSYNQTPSVARPQI